MAVILDIDSSSLSPLSPSLRDGLIGVTVLGFLSFFMSSALFLLLGYRLLTWRRKSKHGYNQFVLLIFNLVLADIQQSVAFLLNAAWLIQDQIHVGTTTCWAQGWFVSTGDLASGVWCFAIGCHTFASVLFDYRMKPRWFFFNIILLWVFIFATACIGIAMHPQDIYVRAGAWCWVNIRYSNLRLWAHYFWIFLAEFGLVLVYAAMYLMLYQRIRTNYFTSVTAVRAKQAANLMVVYPLVYVICTLPLASARMMAMAGRMPSLTHMCVAGAMITSNGWLDVLLYTLTRRITIFSDEPPPESCGIDTFTLPFWSGGNSSRFGTTTIIEATGAGITGNGIAGRGSRGYSNGHARLASRHGSMDELFNGTGVKAETTFDVKNEPLELADIRELHVREEIRHGRCGSKDRMSLDYDSSKASDR